ncbi:Viral IAP-associated factor [Micractinium conductrix]|uniref:Viral IAP-associated factor n=1 Tax=Micractinium conductrix TaxID=554055 RepID=A0A2P6V9P8_9CHLO|nr:Viral IAP-associated factor [Micractinium conductrix]|eukprot:PSC70810.1 Viral IAP-associated factor [Micractinium conductrix]
MELSVKSLGPTYRIVCRDSVAAPPPDPRRPPSSAERTAEEAGAGVGGAGRVLAVTSGFLVPPPLGLMHCDMLQVFTKNQRGDEGARTRGGVLGLGLLMGAATFAFGVAAGCTKAEILAINDDEAWHERLVGYYSRFGFVPVRTVRGDSLADLPHMLVWGGAGTRMDADLRGMLRRWSPAVRRNSPAARPQRQPQGAAAHGGAAPAGAGGGAAAAARADAASAATAAN